MTVYSGVKEHWDSCLCTITGHSHRVMGVAVSPDGKYVASVSHDETVQLWDFLTGTHLQTFHVEDGCSQIAFSHNGDYIACDCSHHVRLWDIMSGACILQLEGHTASIHSIAFSPIANHITSASADGTIQIWDTNNGTNLKTLQALAFSIVYSPNGAHIACRTTGGIIQIWDAVTGSCLKR